MKNSFMLKIYVFLVFFVMVETITKTEANSVSSEEFTKSDVTKALNSSSYVSSEEQNNTFSTNMPHKINNFEVNPVLKSDSQTNKPEQKRNHMMKKLPIKYIDYNRKAKIPLELTTRRSLMKKRKFTVKPHDVYKESVREKNNWKGNRKISRYNFKTSKGEKRLTGKSIKSNNKQDSLADKFINFQNLNYNGLNEFGEEGHKHSYVADDSQETKTILLFPNRNNNYYLKVNNKEADVINIVSDMKIDSSEENVPSPNDKIIRSDCTDLNEEVKPPDNFSDGEEEDQDEIIFVKEANENEISIKNLLSWLPMLKSVPTVITIYLFNISL